MLNGPGTVIVGGVVSITSATVTSNDFVTWFPRVSEVLQETVVVPTGNTDPDDGLQVTVRDPSTRSTADVTKLTARPAGTWVVRVKLEGTVSAGGVVSVTVTVNAFGAETFPEKSVAVQATVVSPTGNMEPEAGEHAVVGAGSRSSVAEAENAAARPFDDVASPTMFAGGTTVGATRSSRRRTTWSPVVRKARFL